MNANKLSDFIKRLEGASDSMKERIEALYLKPQDVRSVADLLGIPEDSLRRYIKRDGLPHFVIGRHIRLIPLEVIEFCRERTKAEKAATTVDFDALMREHAPSSLKIRKRGRAAPRRKE